MPFATRRDFLRTLAGSAAALTVGGTPKTALSQTPLRAPTGVRLGAKLVLLEDFSTLRNNSVGAGYPLWGVYEGPYSSPQTGSLGTNLYQAVAGAGATPYVHFMPYDTDRSWPKAYAQSYVKAGTFDPTCNRLRFLVRLTSGNCARHADDSPLIDVGTYVREHGAADSAYQGRHFYHKNNPNFYQNQWQLYVLNRHPSHEVGASSGDNPIDDPTYVDSGVHYFDGLTRFYLDCGGVTAFQGSTIQIAAFAFYSVDGEPDTDVSTLSAQYTGTRYEVAWTGRKRVAMAYDVAYHTVSMHAVGFSAGTSGGTVSLRGDDYASVYWSSATMAELVTGCYVAIRPRGGSAFTEIHIPYRLNPSSVF